MFYWRYTVETILNEVLKTMKDEQKIRAATASDIEGLKKVIDSSNLFPSEYLEEMIYDYLNNTNTKEIWFTCIADNKPVAIGYCTPEKFTDETYNLRALGVASDYQRSGVATAMMKYSEEALKIKGGRLLIVETSSDSAQFGARIFYEKIGYILGAIIQDFWKEGEDKIVYLKKL